MLFLPIDFSAAVRGRETARKANWEDLSNYNKVQGGQLENVGTALHNKFNVDTYGNQVSMLGNQATTSGLNTQLNVAGQPGKLSDIAANNQIAQYRAGYVSDPQNRQLLTQGAVGPAEQQGLYYGAARQSNLGGSAAGAQAAGNVLSEQNAQQAKTIGELTAPTNIASAEQSSQLRLQKLREQNAYAQSLQQEAAQLQEQSPGMSYAEALHEISTRRMRNMLTQQQPQQAAQQPQGGQPAPALQQSGANAIPPSLLNSGAS